MFDISFLNTYYFIDRFNRVVLVASLSGFSYLYNSVSLLYSLFGEN